MLCTWSKKEVLLLLPEENDQGGDGSDNDHDWSSFVEESGNIDKNFVEKIKDLIEKNIQNKFSLTYIGFLFMINILLMWLNI